MSNERKREANTTTPAPITAENVQSIGERIAVKALKVNLAQGKAPTPEEAKAIREKGKDPGASGNFKYLYNIYCGLIGDITERKHTTAPLSDGYDVAQTAIVALCPYLGRDLNDSADNGETDKAGNPVTILRAAFRAVNRYIKHERTREYKRAYVADFDENGSALCYEIPDEWDIPTAEDFKRIAQTISALNLTARQSQILRYRLRGFSLHRIADIMGIKRQTLQEHIKAIQRKYTAHATE